MLLPRITPAGRRGIAITTQLRRSRKLLSGAAVTARVTAPTLPLQDILKQYQSRLRETNVPSFVAEKGFTAEQLLLAKLAAFAMQYRAKAGGLFARNTEEVKLVDRGGGIYSAKVPLPAKGNITVEVAAHGKLDGFEWQRVAYASVMI